jgi:hypothetical protein
LVIAGSLCSIAWAQVEDSLPLKDWHVPLLWHPTTAKRAEGSSPELKPANPQDLTGPLNFIAIEPCRIVDTRANQGQLVPFGAPSLVGNMTRTFPLQNHTVCIIPSTAEAYSLNLTVVPQGPLGYLSAWPTPNRPVTDVSILNSPSGQLAANAAVIPAGANGAIDVFVTNSTDLIIDINGYYAPASGGSGGGTGTQGPAGPAGPAGPQGPIGHSGTDGRFRSCP